MRLGGSGLCAHFTIVYDHYLLFVSKQYERLLKRVELFLDTELNVSYENYTSIFKQASPWNPLFITH